MAKVKTPQPRPQSAGGASPESMAGTAAPETAMSVSSGATASVADPDGGADLGVSMQQFQGQKDLVSHVLNMAPGSKSVFSVDAGGRSKTFIVYYDQEEARGDRGQRVPGFISGDYEVWTSPTPDDLGSHKEVLRQHVSPGKPKGQQQIYAAEQCARAILASVNR